MRSAEGPKGSSIMSSTCERVKTVLFRSKFEAKVLMEQAQSRDAGHDEKSRNACGDYMNIPLRSGIFRRSHFLHAIKQPCCLLALPLYHSEYHLCMLLDNPQPSVHLTSSR